MKLQGANSDDARVRGFLADSLALWCVAGEVESGEPPVVAVIRAGSGAVVRVERASLQDTGFRWFVHSRIAGGSSEDVGSERSRPCASMVGVLKAMRIALDVDRGSAVRIAPSPEGPPPLRSGEGTMRGQQ
jgi:hypothetical protein